MSKFIISISKQESMQVERNPILGRVLNFACSVVLPGRVFLRRFIQLTMQVSENQKFVSINKECKDEMATWLVFFYSYNGKTMFLDEKFF